MKITILCATLLLGACTTCPDTQRVDIPVSVPQVEPAVIQPPDLYIDRLVPSDESEPDKVARYYKASIIQLQTYVKQLQVQLDAYRSPMNKVYPEETNNGTK